MPKVSIIIPCYNQAEFLLQALEALQEQTLQDFECIIVDDGSTDSSAQIAKDFIKSDNRFHLIKKSNGGTATARNRGLDAATGEYVQFLDADDELDAHKLELQTMKMDKEGLDMCYTDYRHFRITPSGERIMRSHPAYTMRPTGSLHLSLLTRWGIDFSLPIHCIMYRMSFIKKHHLCFSESLRYREDWDFHLRASGQPDFRYGQMPRYVAAFYRENPQSKTSSAQKLSRGNLTYLSYAINNAHTADLLPLTFRLSCELLLIAGRALKHRNLDELYPISILRKGISMRMTTGLVLSVLILPLSILYVFIRSLIVYL